MVQSKNSLRLASDRWAVFEDRLAASVRSGIGEQDFNEALSAACAELGFTKDAGNENSVVLANCIQALVGDWEALAGAGRNLGEIVTLKKDRVRKSEGLRNPLSAAAPQGRTKVAVKSLTESLGLFQLGCRFRLTSGARPRAFQSRTSVGIPADRPRRLHSQGELDDPSASKISK